MKRTRKKRLRLYKIALPLFSFLFALVIAEYVLYRLERYHGYNGFHHFRTYLTPHTIFFDRPTEKRFENFDPLLGWRSSPERPEHLAPGEKTTLNRNRFRHPEINPYKKAKPRILMFGDSHTFGWRMDDHHTIASYLTHFLEDRYEVLNFGVNGYGIGQMAIAATHFGPDYDPDVVIVNFIAQDLFRTCVDTMYDRGKPRYLLENGELSLSNVPVPTPAQLVQQHQKHYWMDWVLSKIKRLRTVSLAGSYLLKDRFYTCQRELNAALMKKIEKTYEGKAPVYFVHLAGRTPKKREQALKRSVRYYISMSPLVWSAGLGIGTHPMNQSDGHPTPALNKIYAKILSDMIRPSRLAHYAD